jgi:hypothetical protein
METRSKEMIELELTKAEALLYMEMIKRNTGEMLEQIAEELDEAVTHEEMKMAAQENYKANLENEAKKVVDLEAELKKLRTKLDAQNLSAKSNTVKTRKPRALKPTAPWGYKKDGTPKQRPGRTPG